MNLNYYDEDHPVWQAIDLGGGQTCDVKGVLRELDKAGYTIESTMPLGSTEKLTGALF